MVVNRIETYKSYAIGTSLFLYLVVVLASIATLNGFSKVLLSYTRIQNDCSLPMEIETVRYNIIEYLNSPKGFKYYKMVLKFLTYLLMLSLIATVVLPIFNATIYKSVFEDVYGRMAVIIAVSVYVIIGRFDAEFNDGDLDTINQNYNTPLKKVKDVITHIYHDSIDEFPPQIKSRIINRKMGLDQVSPESAHDSLIGDKTLYKYLVFSKYSNDMGEIMPKADLIRMWDKFDDIPLFIKTRAIHTIRTNPVYGLQASYYTFIYMNSPAKVLTLSSKSIFEYSSKEVLKQLKINKQSGNSFKYIKSLDITITSNTTVTDVLNKISSSNKPIHVELLPDQCILDYLKDLYINDKNIDSINRIKALLSNFQTDYDSSYKTYDESYTKLNPTEEDISNTASMQKYVDLKLETLNLIKNSVCLSIANGTCDQTIGINRTSNITAPAHLLSSSSAPPSAVSTPLAPLPASTTSSASMKATLSPTEEPRVTTLLNNLSNDEVKLYVLHTLERIFNVTDINPLQAIDSIPNVTDNTFKYFLTKLMNCCIVFSICSIPLLYIFHHIIFSKLSSLYITAIVFSVIIITLLVIILNNEASGL